MVKVKTDADLDRFLQNIYLSINLFQKSLEYIRSTDQTFALEYGSFLYQLASFCSRQIKISKLLPNYFSSSAIEPKLREKQTELLNMSLIVYKTVNELSSPSKGQPSNPKAEEIVSQMGDQDSSLSVGDKSNLNTSEGERSRSAVVKNQTDSGDGDWGEEWLHHYMLGKIKEKLSNPLLECLEHYKTVKII